MEHFYQKIREYIISENQETFLSENQGIFSPFWMKSTNSILEHSIIDYQNSTLLIFENLDAIYKKNRYIS